MKRKFSYFIHMYHSQPFPLNNHKFCDKWCPWKKWGEEERIFK
jgi:hypothetical protein